jgi:hypothetical protein
MKRIAAMAALVITMLAAPAATAMAGTASPKGASSAPKACRPALLRFDLAAGSSTLTEVSCLVTLVLR